MHCRTGRTIVFRMLLTGFALAFLQTSWNVNAYAEDPATQPSENKEEPKTATGPDKLLADAIQTLKKEDFRAFIMMMDEAERPGEDQIEEVIEFVKAAPEQVKFLITIFEAAQKTKPALSKDGNLAVYTITVTPPGGEKEEGHLVLKKVNGKWMVGPMGPGEYEPDDEGSLKPSQRNKLKMIGLALFNYLDTHGTFPGNITDKNGKVLLSWRVAILPFIEQEELYKKFKLDEPWNSEHNIKLLSEMPDIYSDPEAEGKQGQTSFVAPVGMGTVLGHSEGTDIRDVTDGLSHTIMVVRTRSSYNWTEPTDFEFDPNTPKELFNKSGLEGTVLMSDGSVQDVRDLDPEIIIQKFIMNDAKPRSE